MRTICFFAGDITRCGGTEKMTVRLANELAGQPDTRVLIVSWTESASAPCFPLHDAVIRKHLFNGRRPFKLFLLPAIFKLRKLLVRENVTHLIDVDVILSVVSVFARAGLTCKHIAWEHFHFHENLGCMLRDFGRKLAKRYADAIVVLTQDDRRQYQETWSNADVVCIPNVIPEKIDVPVSVSPPDGPFILSVGRLDHQKGFERIPALAEELFRRHSDLKWVVVGDGIYRRRIEQEIQQRGLSGRMILAGWQNPYPFYEKALFLVMTSRYEGFPLVLLEALSEKCPVIGFACKQGPADIIQDGINGFLVSPEDFSVMRDRIEFLLDHPEKREEFSGQAESSIDAFSLAEFMKKWNLLLAGEERT